MSFARDVAAGTVGGLAGGLIMTAFMVGATRVGLIDTPLPTKVERWAEDRAGINERPTGTREEALAQGGHLVFATALGAAYGALNSAFRLPTVPSGPLYGLGLYALDLGALGPGLGITKGPWNVEPTTAGRRMMIHAVFGTVTALVAGRLQR